VSETPNWINPARAIPPVEFHQASLFGQQKQLVRWVCHDGKSAPRRLPGKVQNGVIWMRSITDTNTQLSGYKSNRVRWLGKVGSGFRAFCWLRA
jgi:hypothetical protein